ncbi:hypothetical protein JDW21_19625 [Bacillus subtilis]|uniref:hypothetical protein n=1 Tax=Bacillus subtilis TaxID=1423 RepID=UPI00215026C1|nr:hypothetical protein [Bacillus subtilis]MCR4361977.1 hypothetical protein [Bacillus subtilis]WOF32829.1 hypothetical protein OEJ84_23245 [Bacillus subtilis]
MAKTKQNSFFFESDEEAVRVLHQEGRKLKYCALKVWRKYLSSYRPKKYARTGKSLKSIKLGKVKRLGVNEWGIEVTFINDLAYHDSVIGASEPKGHAIMLISHGWKVKRGRHKDVYRFGYFEGFDYLGKVKEMYNNTKDRRVNLDIQWLGGKDYTKR